MKLIKFNKIHRKKLKNLKFRIKKLLMNKHRKNPGKFTRFMIQTLIFRLTSWLGFVKLRKKPSKIS